MLKLSSPNIAKPDVMGICSFILSNIILIIHLLSWLFIDAVGVSRLLMKTNKITER